MPSGRRYPTDLTDQQWALIEPLLPDPPPGPAGRPPAHDKREIINAILYINRAGCAWRMLPKDFPPWQTVYWYLWRWRKDGAVDRIHDRLREQVRVKEGRESPEPSAGILDCQSVKGADTVPAATRGYDAGKKINGRKRHIITDTLGLLLLVVVTAACVQDRDGARPALKRPKRRLPSVGHIFADGGYSGQLVATAKSAWRIVIEIVKRPAGQKGFQILPRRWVVERTLSWLYRYRRLRSDYERLTQTHQAFVKWGMINLMLNRLAPPPGPKAWATPNSRAP